MLLKTAMFYSPELAQAHPSVTFLFGDNLVGAGLAGQACIRREPNALGVPTKRSPSMGYDAFFHDGDADTQYAVGAARAALELSQTQDVVVPVTEDGRMSLGLGLAKLNETAPDLYAEIGSILDVSKARTFEVEMLRRNLRTMFDSRNTALGRKPNHKKTGELELEFLVGAGQALEAVGNPLSSAVTMWAFLQSTGRDPLRS